jgi:hypothetical protein
MNIDEVIEWLTTAQLRSLSPEEVRKLPKLNGASTALVTAHEIAHSSFPSPVETKSAEADEDLIGKAEAARLLGVDPHWFAGRKLPFKTKLGHRTVKFSRKGLLKWREARAIKR